MDIDIEKYRELFFQESREYLTVIFSHLSRLSQENFDKEAINEIFRAAHSIKGMAASVDFEDVARLSHAIENLFDMFRKGEKFHSKKIFGIIFNAVKTLESLIEKHQRKEGGGVNIDRLLHEINQVINEKEEKDEKIDEAKVEKGKKEIEFEVEIDRNIDSPAVRAYMVLRKLKEYGEIISSNPSIAELKKGIFRGILKVKLSTQDAEENIKNVIKNINGISDFRIIEPEKQIAKEVKGHSETIRVRSEIFDHLLTVTGELIVAKSRLLESVKEKLTPEELIYFENISSLITEIKDTVLSARLLPLSFLTDRLPRVVLESAQNTGKEVNFTVNGENVELDRAVLDALHDPLTHILRNSVDHGIEFPEERERLGKSRRGKIELNARRVGEFVEIDIIDDGKGMDVDALKRKAVALGVITEEQAFKMSYNDALYLACIPGLSTRNDVTATSGRGVGLDVVKNLVESRGGILFISSEPGRGTIISLKLPLNISILRALILEASGEQFGIQLSNIEKVFELNPDFFSRTEHLYELDGKMLMIMDAGKFFGSNGFNPRVGILLNSRKGHFILAVESIVSLGELYVMPVPKPLASLPQLNGVSITGSGKPIFILDPNFLEVESVNEFH